jgi:hypothetical protein
MHEQAIDEVIVTERVNGWWVSVRYGSGHEEHHGPYLDEDSALAEADILSAGPQDDPHQSFQDQFPESGDTDAVSH